MKRLLLSLSIALFLCGCGGGSSSTSTQASAPTLATITVSAADSSVAVGSTDQFTATAKDTNGDTMSGVTFTWASSSTSVATISTEGLATGVLAGTTQITASSGGVTSSGVALTVTPGPLTTITVSPSSPSITVGGTQQFTAVGKDSGGDTLTGLTFTWASSASGVATIDSSSGLATGVAVGTTSITASSGGITSSQDTLTVTPVPSAVTGTAAEGSPIAAANVTLADSAGHTSTGTTASDGSFTLETTGFTPPFLVQVQTSNGNLYSVSADTLLSTNINVHPYTDLIIRSWYSAQGVSIDTAFSNPTSAPAPTPASVQLVGNAVTNVAQLWLTNAGVNTTQFNLISTPFLANGAGLDQVLDETTVNTSNGTVTITGGGTTQTSTVTYNSTASTMTVSTTTTNSNGTTQGSSTTVVPTQSAQQTALDGINTTMTAYANAINTNGSQLTAAEITSFLSSDLLYDGLNQTQYADLLATYLRGQTISPKIQQVKSLNLGNGTADIVFNTSLNWSSINPEEVWFENANGTWLIGGNNEIIQINLQVEDRTEEGDQSSTGVYISPNTWALVGTVNSVAVTDASGITGWSDTALVQDATDLLTLQPTPSSQLTLNFDQFDYSGGWLDLGTTIVPAGTIFTFTVTPASGPVVTYNQPSNVFTTEGISISSPTSGVLANYTLGQPLTVAWALPTTFPIASVSLSAEAWNGPRSNPASADCLTTGQTNATASGAFPTSGTITIPATCSGSAVVALEIHASVTGVDGELTQATVNAQ